MTFQEYMTFGCDKVGFFKFYIMQVVMFVYEISDINIFLFGLLQFRIDLL